jgi:hypothetical protein
MIDYETCCKIHNAHHKQGLKLRGDEISVSAKQAARLIGLTHPLGVK